MSKERLTVTVDTDLLAAGNKAVAEGHAGSLSAWVNAALAERAAKDRRLRALTEAVSAYEAEFGVITPEEIARQARADQASARVIRSALPRASRAPGRRRRGAA